METTFPSRRRRLPPVPRRAADRVATGRIAATPPPEPSVPAPAVAPDDEQDFVARLRAAAGAFARAAGAQTVVVREAVPPARHRRSRCRIALRDADGGETDLTFLGDVGPPGPGFERRIEAWLAAGRPRESGWLVGDVDAPDGTAIDVTAWPAGARPVGGRRSFYDFH